MVTIVPIQLEDETPLEGDDSGGHAEDMIPTTPTATTPQGKMRDHLIALRLAKELEKEHHTHFKIDSPEMNLSLLQRTMTNDLESDEVAVEASKARNPLESDPAVIAAATTSLAPAHLPVELEYRGWLPLHENAEKFFFQNRRTVLQIQEAMERHSGTASLVLFNLPTPGDDNQTLTMETGIRESVCDGYYSRTVDMELVERLTSSIPRSILVYGGRHFTSILHVL